MKRLLSAFAAFTALTAAASAADLPRRVAPPVIAPVPVFTWTGFYAGFNAGYGFDASSTNPDVIVLTRDPRVVAGPAGSALAIGWTGDRNTEGFSGGGQIGYNYQFTPGAGVVVGIEADAQYVDFGRNRNAFSFAIPNQPGAQFNGANGLRLFDPRGLSGLDYFGTVRGRLGYAFDRVLFYGTGGFAYGGGGGTNFGLPNTDDFQTGWTAGGGIEYALPTDSFLNFFRSSAVTLKVEGLYVNLDRNRRNGAYAFDNAGVIVAGLPNSIILSNTAGFPAVGNLARRNTEFAVVRAGLNYKFGTW
ncbi:porin [Methylobacterium sp. 4-46]|uniref:outer membrane protein n=1 Tax=unclassified Methylobacterium TaxID=2615210 RepID=UPI000152CF34|nr:MULTISPECIES: outer membrane beta-barrel protein [Methylobacterium]ACA15038.1 porin [Methylobacterium sp. 4-46]WFT80776.1 outer membrane beta-barrel protein [Methylobacterium nodulans]